MNYKKVTDKIFIKAQGKKTRKNTRNILAIINNSQDTSHQLLRGIQRKGKYWCVDINVTYFKQQIIGSECMSKMVAQFMLLIKSYNKEASHYMILKVWSQTMP